MRNNKLGLLGLTTLMLACVGATAFAQDAGAPAAGGAPAGGGRQGGGRQGGGRQGGMFGGRQVSLSNLTVATMDYGLKLTGTQKTQIQAILDQQTKDLKALPTPQPPMPGDPPPDPQAMRDARQKRGEISTKATTDITAILTPDQKAKLPDFIKELQSYQQAGIPVAIMGDLKLTADQKTKIAAQVQANQQAVQQKMQEAQQAGQNPRAVFQDPAFQTMMKDNQDKISALLTPTQHTMIDKYVQAHPQPAFGGPGGFGGRGGRGGAPGAPAGAPGGAPGGN